MLNIRRLLIIVVIFGFWNFLIHYDPSFIGFSVLKDTELSVSGGNSLYVGLAIVTLLIFIIFGRSVSKNKGVIKSKSSTKSKKKVTKKKVVSKKIVKRKANNKKVAVKKKSSKRSKR